MYKREGESVHMKRGYERVGVQNAVVAGTRKPERRGRGGGKCTVISQVIPNTVRHDKCVSTL